MTDEWSAQICDFGLSRLISADHTGHTTSTVHVGTARYCAPELVESDGDQPSGPTAESDIYALACVTLDVSS
jgi:serine/threonine protein kinase